MSCIGQYFYIIVSNNMYCIVCVSVCVFWYGGLSLMLGGWAIVVKCCKTEDDLAA
jgi:hypothetical protein